MGRSNDTFRLEKNIQSSNSRRIKHMEKRLAEIEKEKSTR